MTRPRMTRLTPYVLLIFTLSFSSAFAQTKKDKKDKKPVSSSIDPNDYLLKPVVLIQSDLGTGAGFLVGERAGTLYFLTAYHVIRDPDHVIPDPTDIQLRFHGIETAPAEVIQVHEKLDVAVIACTAPAGYKAPPSFKVASTAANVRQKVITVGHPASNNWDINYRDEIKTLSHDFNSQLLTITPNGISTGSSGGPILNENHELMGLVSEEDEIKAIGVSQPLLLQMMKDWDVPTNLLVGWNTISIDPPTPEPTLQSYTDPLVGKMVFLRGGSYHRGSSYKEDNAQPVREVRVNDFFIASTEVTQAQWKAIMGNNLSSFKNCDACPADQISWEDAQRFIKKLNQKTGHTYRLPTEAEWEYAAKGGKLSRGYVYAGGNQVDEVGWHQYNSGKKTHAVARKRPNEIGLYDMSGNVWEWCSDWYDPNYYSSSPTDNPKGPATAARRSMRGGSWRGPQTMLRVTRRDGWYAGERLTHVGFRLARTP